MSSVDRNYGLVGQTHIESGLSVTEIVSIRFLGQEGMDAEEISVEMGIDYPFVLQVLSGEIAPCAGGVLQVPLDSALDLRNMPCRKAIVEIYARALTWMTDDEFEVFCNQNGTDVEKAKTLISNLEVRDEREDRLEYRDFIMCCSKSKTGRYED